MLGLLSATGESHGARLRARRAVNKRRRVQEDLSTQKTFDEPSTWQLDGKPRPTHLCLRDGTKGIRHSPNHGFREPREVPDTDRPALKVHGASEKEAHFSFSRHGGSESDGQRRSSHAIRTMQRGRSCLVKKARLRRWYLLVRSHPAFRHQSSRDCEANAGDDTWHARRRQCDVTGHPACWHDSHSAYRRKQPPTRLCTRRM